MSIKNKTSNLTEYSDNEILNSTQIAITTPNWGNYMDNITIGNTIYDQAFSYTEPLINTDVIWKSVSVYGPVHLDVANNSEYDLVRDFIKGKSLENLEHVPGEVTHRDIQGRYHCEDGPAIIYDNGTKKWLRHGKLHREDGPAIEWGTGSSAYFLNGEEYSKDDWDNKLLEIKLGRIKYL